METVKNYFSAAGSAFLSSVARAPRRWTLSLAVLVLLVGGYLSCAPPAQFPTGSIISISRGASLPEVANQLADAHIVAHAPVVRFIIRISGKSGDIQAGAYRFDAPQNAITVALRLMSGAYGVPPVRITFPEGETIRDNAMRIHELFPDISAEDFLSLAERHEGYLFPDTYLFLPWADSDLIIRTMRANFDTRTASLAGDIERSGHSLSDIVVMASLVEKEARTTENRRIVAGVLWNRLARGMPLQVDAVFGYIFGRDTYSPSFADLKVDSPYNTYTHTGLPPGPICNPGLDALNAVIHPTKTDYLYYLTGKDNLMHYATTYAGHQANQRKYLK